MVDGSDTVTGDGAGDGHATGDGDATGNGDATGDGDATDDVETYTCEFEKAGETIEVAEDEYVLEAALEADLDVQYACLQGVCASCSARVEGEVDQTEERVLTHWEKQQGYALLCVAYPRSDLVIQENEEP